MYETISQTNVGGKASQDLLPTFQEDRAERGTLTGPSVSGPTSKSFLMRPRRQGVRVARREPQGQPLLCVPYRRYIYRLEALCGFLGSPNPHQTRWSGDK